MRIGIGFDSHRLVKGKRLILGGVDIPFDRGLYGHSDADVLCHAIIDSIIGALGLGDIGSHFPDTDERWKDVSSIHLLSETVNLMRKRGFEILWIDSVIMAERPKMEPFIDSMKRNISMAGIPLERINIKAKTAEGMGPIGRDEGMAAHAVCLLVQVENKDS